MLALASPASMEPLLGTPAGLAVVAASGSLTALGLVLVRRIMAGAGA
jgi:Flp pilus assembly protein TadB